MLHSQLNEYYYAKRTFMPLDNNGLNINYSSTKMQPILSPQSQQKAEQEIGLFQSLKYFYFIKVLFGPTTDKQKETHSHK